MPIESEIAPNADSRGEAQELAPRRVTAPAVDIYENPDEYLIVADLPGLDEDRVHVDLDDDKLSLTADRDDLRYRRSFRIPQAVDRSAIVARLERGVLELHLPKSAEVKPRRIQINGS